MPLVQVGITALRAPNGDFLPAAPIYAEVERLTPEGIAPQEDKTLNDLSRIMSRKFKAYIDGCKAEERKQEDNK